MDWVEKVIGFRPCEEFIFIFLSILCVAIFQRAIFFAGSVASRSAWSKSL